MKTSHPEAGLAELADDDQQLPAEDAGFSGWLEPKPVNPWVPISPRIRYALLGVLLVYTLICVVGALANTAQNSSSPLLAVSTFIYLAAVAFPLISYDRDRQGWFHPLVFSTLMLMVRSLPRRMGFFILGLNSHAVLSLSAEDLTRLLAYENILNALALVSTYAGFYFVRRLPLPSLRLSTPQRLWGVVAVTGLLSLVALGLLVELSGNLSQHILNLTLNSAAKVFAEDASVYGQLASLAGWFALSLAMALAYRSEVLRKPLFWALCLVALGMVYFATGKRSQLLTPVAIGTIVWMLSIRQVPLFRLSVLLVAAFVSFSLLLVVRMASTNARNLDEMGAGFSERAGDAFSWGTMELIYRGGAYSSVYPILHYVPEESPLLWGETYLTILARPIPRGLWPTKPRGTDYLAGSTFFNSVWGIPPGAVAEAYWNFHIPGVIGVFFLFGLFNRWLHNLYLKYHEHGLIVFFYAFTILIFSPTENTITQWMLALLPALVFGFATGIIRLGGNSGR